MRSVELEAAKGRLLWMVEGSQMHAFVDGSPEAARGSLSRRALPRQPEDASLDEGGEHHCQNKGGRTDLQPPGSHPAREGEHPDKTLDEVLKATRGGLR